MRDLQGYSNCPAFYYEPPLARRQTEGVSSNLCRPRSTIHQPPFPSSQCVGADLWKTDNLCLIKERIAD